MATFAEQLTEAHKLPSEELKRHASVAAMEGQTRCRECFCCAAEVVLWQRGLFGGVKNNGHTCTPECRFPAPPVATVYWDGASWDAHYLSSCPCKVHAAMRATLKVS